uniref:Catechol-O-methyltransferase domain containing 1 n=1 Tax=Sinocyclocheilus anshuiensis TaxID=1608454 RepID=A0A671SJP7_9TELE
IATFNEYLNFHNVYFMFDVFIDAHNYSQLFIKPIKWKIIILLLYKTLKKLTDPKLLNSCVYVLKMLVHMSKAKRVLEIGMFTGYGALSMAEALPENGQIVACELEPYLKEFAQPIFDKSPHGKKITVKTGPAMDTLKELAATGEQFDMVFIDADKHNYINYYKFLLDHNLLRIDGVICVDNTLFKGRVYLKDSADDFGKALRDFNQVVTNDFRVEQVCKFFSQI